MIGIDVGGANLKIVNENGVYIHYCPLWENAPLTAFLDPYVPAPGEPAAVVMSGELADCFSHKGEGISFIVNAVKKAFPHALFYGTDGRFHDHAVPQLAAANWLASADFLRADYPAAVLLDFGSTTADIIPLGRFESLLGLSDLHRLQKGYLVYTGMLRGNVATLLQSVEVDTVNTPVSSEFFATAADAHLVLGHITPSAYLCDTADKAEKTRSASLRRLARVVCADLDEIGEKNAVGIAQQFWDSQRNLIANQVRSVMEASGSTHVLTAGIGAPLFARELGGTDLSCELGERADALPAYAVREVALRDGIFSPLPDQKKR
jgi:probable H4MPT-linked C1 transfer pathway protein